jgi:Ni/Co efflux regulator RcnB
MNCRDNLKGLCRERTKMKRIIFAILFASMLLSPLSAGAADQSENWRNLSPKEKDKVLRNYQRWQTLPPQDKEHLREEWDRWQRLPQDRRDRLKRRYEEEGRGRDNR